jgi:lipoyl-dependent peroxiredoxin
MARVLRTADCTWTGDLPGGRGTLTVGSGALRDQAVTWASRAERPNGWTSPEELRVHATCSQKLEGEPRITAMDLRAVGVVPGLNREAFRDAITAAAALCPVSNALRDNVQVIVAGELAEEASAHRA